MIFRPITISKEGEPHLSFSPDKIISIAIDLGEIRILESRENQEPLETIIYKKNYDYSAWSYFIIQLHRTFIL